MKKTSFALASVAKAALLSIAMMTSANALDGVAVLDLQRIMKDSLAAKSLRDQIEKKREQFQGEISKDEERLRKRDKELAEQRNVMAADKFEQEKNSFKNEVESVQREVQKKRVQLDRAYAKSLEEVQNAVSAVVKEVSAEQKLAMTVPAGGTVFYDPKLDITETVLSRLDKKLAKVTVKIEPIEEPKEAKKK